ncbi:hypothetical protein D3C75_1037960 [compost metagenome]
MYVTAVHDIGVLGAACCLAYVCCGALRLARFNAGQSHMSGFVGMPTPMAAVLVLLIAVLLPQPLAAIGMLVIGALMVSRLSFPSLKKMKPEVAEEY